MVVSPSLFASSIIGTGSAFPSRVVSNDELCKKVDTSDEWIRERTGIVTRNICDTTRLDERNSSLSASAALRALEMAHKTALDIDGIIYATCTPDTPIPSTACWLQNKIGATRAWAFDLNAACSGFLFALTVADQFIRNGQAKNLLVIGSEVLSSFTNWSDRNSCILFGDGAGAAVVTAVPHQSVSRILSSHLRCDGSQTESLMVPSGGSNQEVSAEVISAGTHKIQMNGREIFKFAVKTMAEYIHLGADANQLKLSDIDWIIPHQANHRIIEGMAHRLDFPMSKVIVNIHEHANTSAATVITALDEAVRDGRIQKGQTIALTAVGAGLTYGSVFLRW